MSVADKTAKAIFDGAISRRQKEWDECRDDLLQDVPTTGGEVDRKTLEALIRCAFASGVLAESLSMPAPQPSTLNSQLPQ